MAAILVIAFTGSTDSGSPTEPLAPQSSQARGLTAPSRAAPVQGSGAVVPTSRPRGCLSARKAVKFYQDRVLYWTRKMGATARPKISGRDSGGNARARGGCPRYLAHVLQRKAYAAHRAFIRWQRDEWNWRAWLPAKFMRVARCETGIRWDWDSGTYVSAFGILRSAYEAYHPWTGHNSPREQYEVAAAIQRRFSWSAWGCGGA